MQGGQGCVVHRPEYTWPLLNSYPCPTPLFPWQARDDGVVVCSSVAAACSIATAELVRRPRSRDDVGVKPGCRRRMGTSRLLRRFITNFWRPVGCV